MSPTRHQERRRRRRRRLRLWRDRLRRLRPRIWRILGRIAIVVGLFVGVPAALELLGLTSVLDGLRRPAPIVRQAALVIEPAIRSVQQTPDPYASERGREPSVLIIQSPIFAPLSPPQSLPPARPQHPSVPPLRGTPVYVHDNYGWELSGRIIDLKRAVVRNATISVGYVRYRSDGEKIVWRRQCTSVAIESDHVFCYAMFVPDTDSWFRNEDSSGAFLYEHHVFRTTGLSEFQKISASGEEHGESQERRLELRWFAEG